MKKIWKRMLASGCAAVMSMTMPGMCVLADEMKEETFVTEAEVPEESVNSVDSLDEDVTEVVAENIDQGEVEEVVGEGPIQVGDGVTATFDADTGVVEFTSQDGELWRDWGSKLMGYSYKNMVKSITVSSGIVHLPTDSSYMFAECSELTSLDFKNFDTSNVTDMSDMFCWCEKLYDLDLSNFVTSNITDMGEMFNGCSSLTNLDLTSFDTSNVTNMGGMFAQCKSLINLDISSFDTSKVTSMSGMFEGCSSLTTLDVSNFDTSNVTYMPFMFAACGLTKLDLSSFDTSNVTSMYGMFVFCNNLTNLDVNNFVTTNVPDMSDMFKGCSNLTNLDLSSFDTSNVTNMSEIFSGCSSLTNLDLSRFDTSNVWDMSYMFSDCSSLTNLDLNNFVTSKVWNMSYMFSDCSSLTNLDLNNFVTSKVNSMCSMFSGCSSLTNLDLSSFDTSNVSDLADMFRNCCNLKYLDLSSFIIDKGKFEEFWAGRMFDMCDSLEILRTPKTNTTSISLPYIMFDSSGKSYIELPRLTKSIVLARTQQLAKETEQPSEPPASSGFSDVQDLSHPYYNAIYWAAEKGITKGYSDGTFGINRSCTRGEMMMFLWRFARKPVPKAVSKSPFKDVPKTHTFYKPILWGYQKGITKGYSDGTFGINRNVSRGEAMMFLWKLKGKKAPKAVSKSPFKDVPMSHPFYKAILWGSQKGITKGYTSGPKKGNFGINDNCTRGQIVTFLYNRGQVPLNFYKPIQGLQDFSCGPY